jgi:release factor glutamine methyltransferase
MSQGRDAWTVAKVVAWAGEDFRKRGIESARLDAELLLARVLGCDRIRLILDAERPLSDAELGTYRELIRRRRSYEPIAYILGEREFFGLSFKVDARVLVPRPDTETLVTTALRRSEHHDQFGTALDLCTGSGCVAIAFALRRPTWQTSATDLESGALDVARTNALRLGAASVAFRQGDLFEAVAPDDRFTLITANPPYIPDGEIASLQNDVQHHEPHRALCGGETGLDLLSRIVSSAAIHLETHGVLAVEVGFGQATAVAEMFAAAAFVAIERDQDYGGRDRVVSGQRPDR